MHCDIVIRYQAKNYNIGLVYRQLIRCRSDKKYITMRRILADFSRINSIYLFDPFKLNLCLLGVAWSGKGRNASAVYISSVDLIQTIDHGLDTIEGLAGCGVRMVRVLRRAFRTTLGFHGWNSSRQSIGLACIKLLNNPSKKHGTGWLIITVQCGACQWHC